MAATSISRRAKLMTALETLADLGFQNSSIVLEKRGQVTVRVRTSKGWTYQKFTEGDGLEASVRAWAVDHLPE